MRFTGDLSHFESSPGVRRGFCGRCGSTLTYEGDRWPGEIHLHVGAFDDPGTLAPTGHAFADERLSWLKLLILFIHQNVAFGVHSSVLNVALQ